jgi:hypothetical protein
MSGRHDKQIDWEVIRSRITTRGPDGLFLPAITGNESDEELRALVNEFIQKCPLKQEHNCPFRILGGLSSDSQKSVVSKLKREDIIAFFEMERESRNSVIAKTKQTTGCKCVKEV